MYIFNFIFLRNFYVSFPTLILERSSDNLTLIHNVTNDNEICNSEELQDIINVIYTKQSIEPEAIVLSENMKDNNEFKPKNCDKIKIFLMDLIKGFLIE